MQNEVGRKDDREDRENREDRTNGIDGIDGKSPSSEAPPFIPSSKAVLFILSKDIIGTEGQQRE